MKQLNGCMLEVKRHVKQIGKTRDETYGKTTNETCKRKIENNPKPIGYIRGTWRIVTVAPSEPLHFSEEKKHSRRHHLR
jgi:hypothetical protein